MIRFSSGIENFVIHEFPTVHLICAKPALRDQFHVDKITLDYTKSRSNELFSLPFLCVMGSNLFLEREKAKKRKKFFNGKKMVFYFLVFPDLHSRRLIIQSARKGTTISFRRNFVLANSFYFSNGYTKGNW